MAWATAATRNLLPRSSGKEAQAAAAADRASQEADQHQAWQVPANLSQHRVGALQFTSLLLQQLRRGAKARADKVLSGADASQLMYALGRLKYRATRGQRAWLVKQVVKAAGQNQLTAKQAALVLWGLGRLGWRDTGAVAALRGVLVKERLYLRPAYAAAALAGLARLGWTDGPIIEAACKVGVGQGVWGLLVVTS
jgi:hypothetical protein